MFQAELPQPAGDARRIDAPLLICDLTQSYSPTAGGGISTYLREKRDYILDHTPHELIQIVPGPEDKVVRNGRHIFAEVGSKQVRGSPDYRFILRTSAVRGLLEEYRPDVIESLCPWVLPWTAIRYRRAFPETVLVAGYRTDFPNAHVYRVADQLWGPHVARVMRRITYNYARRTYRQFDHIYTLGEPQRKTLAGIGIHNTSVLPLGVDTRLFSPERRDPGFREELGLTAKGPLLIYAGRIDNEKRADRLVGMFRQLSMEMDAGLIMLGDGKLRGALIEETRGMQVVFPGFQRGREDLARALASSDIYVSAMADETFGVSVL
jgi:alpha-1,6-mannosyltransferase